MQRMKVTDTGIIYRNPVPHLCARHAYFPSVVNLADGGMLASYTIGEAFEAVNLHTEVSRSTDGIEWEAMGPAFIFGDTDEPVCEASRITSMSDGSVLALVSQFDRHSHPGAGLSNEDTLGLVDTVFMTSRSVDGGSSWSTPVAFDTPLVGPSFELCSSIFTLDDQLVFATSTWRNWDGDAPNGMKMISIASNDGGVSWPMYANVMEDPEAKRIYWESKIVELVDGRLLAVAWVYNEAEGKDEQNHYAVSNDRGRTWSHPKSTGLNGQTMTPLVLGDGRVFFVYRRIDKPGLWAGVASIDGEVWNTTELIQIWNGGIPLDDGTDAPDAGLNTAGMVEAFQNLRFGAPSVVTHADGSVYLAFWAYEDCVSVIRYIKLGT